MPEEHFILKSREEVARFEGLAYSYATRRAQFPLRHIPLTAAYDYCQTREDGGKLFAALLDIFVSFLLLYCDSHEVGSTWNEYFSKGKLEGGSILDSEQKFFGKMDIHRYNTAFVLRYRALWDKLMGLLVMVFVPSRYEEFRRSKSRRRSFRKLSSEVTGLPKIVVDQLEAILEGFDNKFRTPEIHGTGALRKWSFQMESMANNPSVELIGYWNVLLLVIVAVGKMFESSTAAAEAPAVPT